MLFGLYTSPFRPPARDSLEHNLAVAERLVRAGVGWIPFFPGAGRAIRRPEMFLEHVQAVSQAGLSLGINPLKRAEANRWDSSARERWFCRLAALKERPEIATIYGGHEIFRWAGRAVRKQLLEQIYRHFGKAALPVLYYGGAEKLIHAGGEVGGDLPHVVWVGLNAGNGRDAEFHLRHDAMLFSLLQWARDHLERVTDRRYKLAVHFNVPPEVPGKGVTRILRRIARTGVWAVLLRVADKNGRPIPTPDRLIEAVGEI